jgi:hypothetical protein
MQTMEALDPTQGEHEVWVTDPCGAATTVDLCADRSEVVGTVTVVNDDTGIKVSYATTGNWYLTEVHLSIQSSPESFPRTPSGNPIPGHFELKSSPELATQSVDLCRTIAGLELQAGDLVYVAAQATVVLLEEGREVTKAGAWGGACGVERHLGKGWAAYFTHVLQACDEPPPLPPECPPVEGFRTYTAADWGASPASNAGAQYLHAHFGGCVADAIEVGCPTDGFSVTLDSPQAIEALLPTLGAAGALGQSYQNPTATEAGVFLGEVVALSLNIMFDLCDPSFSPSFAPFYALRVSDPGGPFDGWMVLNVFLTANQMLGGCYSGTATIDDMTECVSRINSAFVDGAPHTGCYLTP